MAIQKFGDVEKLEVLRGEEAQVLNDHMERTGKYKVSDFTPVEKEQLALDLHATKSWEDEGGSASPDQPNPPKGSGVRRSK